MYHYISFLIIVTIFTWVFFPRWWKRQSRIPSWAASQYPTSLAPDNKTASNFVPASPVTWNSLIFKQISGLVKGFCNHVPYVQGLWTCTSTSYCIHVDSDKIDPILSCLRSWLMQRSPVFFADDDTVTAKAVANDAVRNSLPGPSVFLRYSYNNDALNTVSKVVQFLFANGGRIISPFKANKILLRS